MPDTPATLAVREATLRLGINLPALVAEVGLWAHPETHARLVTAANPTGAVRPDVRRGRPGSERPGDVVDGIRLDRNNYAGQAIRDAIGLPRADVRGYQACHVWPDSCYDPRYHTVLANLVLIPGPLVSLTDHDPDVIAALKYRAFERFGWRPLEAPAPERPEGYPTRWAEAPVPTEGARTNNRVTTGARRGESQRDVMRRLWQTTGGDEAAMIAGWVRAVAAGEVERQSNTRGMTEEQYARMLLANARTYGWLTP